MGRLPDKTLEKLFTTEQASELLGVKSLMIRSWCSVRRISFVKVDHLVRFDRKRLERWATIFGTMMSSRISQLVGDLRLILKSRIKLKFVEDENAINKEKSGIFSG